MTYVSATDWTTSKNKVVVHLHLSGPDGSAQQTATLEQRVRNEFPGASPVKPATDSYNCHAFAHARSHAWFQAPEPFLQDDCVKVAPPLAIQPGDRFIYADRGVITHSALVVRLPAGQPAVLQSKWGGWPVVEHGEKNVPQVYGSVVAIYRKAAALSEQEAPMTNDEASVSELLASFLSEAHLQDVSLASSADVAELIVRSWPEFTSLVLESLAATPLIESAVDTATGGELVPLIVLAGEIGTPRLLRALISVAEKDVGDSTIRLIAKKASALRIELETPDTLVAELRGMMDRFE